MLDNEYFLHHIINRLDLEHHNINMLDFLQNIINVLDFLQNNINVLGFTYFMLLVVVCGTHNLANFFNLIFL